MTREAPSPAEDLAPAEDLGLAAALLAVDPAGLGGASLRAPPGPAREAWLALLRGLMPPGAPWRRAPPGIPDDRLLGGLDLAATLATGRRAAGRGLLAEADGGLVLLAMAERLPAGTAARLAAVLDTGEAVVERDGIGRRLPARLALLALDEGMAEEERPPPALLDRLAFHLAPDAMPESAAVPGDIAAARARLAAMGVPDDLPEALCAAALALGIASLRGPPAGTPRGPRRGGAGRARRGGGGGGTPRRPPRSRPARDGAAGSGRGTTA